MDFLDGKQPLSAPLELVAAPSGADHWYQAAKKIENNESWTEQQPAETKQEGKYKFLNIDSLFNRPDPEWLINNMIPEKSLTVAFGPSGSLKSFFILDMCLSLAYGLPWKDREAKQGGVIYIAGEGQSGIKKRVRAWQKHHGMDGRNDVPFYLIPNPVNMSDISEGVIPFVSEAIAAIPDFNNVKMIVVDTLNRSLQGDENSAQDIAKFITGCGVLQQGLNAAVVVVHHSGKNAEKGMRGSSAIYAAADTVICIDKAGGHYVRVSCDKQKDSAEFEQFLLEYSEVETEFGSSLVLDVASGGIEEKSESKEDARKLILDVLRNHPDGLTLSEITEKTEVPQPSVYRYKKELEEAGVMVSRGKRNRSDLYFYEGGIRGY